MVQRLHPPRAHALKVLWQWLHRRSMGDDALRGIDRHTWGDDNYPSNTDLLSLETSENTDIFSNWFSEKLLSFYHKVVRSRINRPVDMESGVCSYQDHIIQRCISCVTVTVASLIPILATVVLFYVRAMQARLVLVALFTTIFTISLTVLTNAKKAEIFAATSTYVLCYSSSCVTFANKILTIDLLLSK
jgi:VIT1/CCC1 family predicted Fe2+/Mn2+ transporter